MDRSRVLVLNASYEPLQLVPVESAVRLVICEKAEVLETGEKAPKCALCTGHTACYPAQPLYSDAAPACSVHGGVSCFGMSSPASIAVHGCRRIC